MLFTLKGIFHSLTLRLPQSIALRSGLRVNTFNKNDNSLFWTLFTSKEYLSFLPYLIKNEIKPTLIIDCGAACGYFSLMIEHLCRCGVLEWNPNYLLIEPIDFNCKKILLNLNDNNLRNRFSIENKLVGKKFGYDNILFDKNKPWGATIYKSNKKTKRNTKSIEYYDLSSNLKNNQILLKLDIEGAEFEFIKSYENNFENILVIIIEWHHEYGNIDEAKGILLNKGFWHAHTSLSKKNRSVELFLSTRFL